jgi:formyl-CoA transferase
MGEPGLKDDPRFKDAGVRFANKEECVATLDAIFARHTLEQWKARLAGFSGVWAPVISVKEVHEHPQVGPNGYLPTITDNDGVDFRIVSAPMQFDDEPTVPQSAAPELGQHTELVLMDAGMDWDEINSYRDKGALG